ncbi:MAG: VWA domain-containing protein [Candidatus Kapaibacteriota bacterium]
MFRFENEFFLYFLYLLPIYVIIFVWNIFSNKKKLSKLGNLDFINKLIPDKSNFKSNFKFIIQLLAFASIVIGLANPQLGTKPQKVKREGIEIIIALDISQSMLSEDIKPNRLERARQSIYSLTDKLVNDKIGLICFAGASYLHLPLTTDYSAAKLITSTVNTDLIQTQGTAIGSAIELATKSFSEGDKISKALVIITDGENHEDDAISAAKDAANKGIKVHCIGMGSIKGGPVPLYRNGNKIGFLEDDNGNTVITKLDANALGQIASTGEGNFIRGNTTDTDILDLIKNLSGMKKSEFETKIYLEYESYFQYFLAFGLILLFLEVLFNNKKSKFWTKINLSSTTVFLLVISLFYILNVNNLYAADNNTFEGNKLYKDKKFKDAEQKYKNSIKILNKNAENDNNDKSIINKKEIAKFNLGNAAYKQDSTNNSIDSYLDIVNSTKNKELKSKAYYNLGNSYLKDKKYQESINAYINSLKNNPEDKDTKYNLEYARQMLATQEKQNQQNKDNKEDKDSKNKQDQNKDSKDNKDGKDNKDSKDQQNKDDKNKDGKDKKEGQQNENQDKKDNQKQGENGQENQDKLDQEKQKQNQQAQRKPNITKEDAERILQAIQNNEKKILKERLRETKKSKTGKKW